MSPAVTLRPRRTPRNYNDQARLPASINGPQIPAKHALELYSAIILPQLENDPQSLDELGVPRYAVKHLERAGLVEARTVTTRTRRCILARRLGIDVVVTPSNLVTM